MEKVFCRFLVNGRRMIEISMLLYVNIVVRIDVKRIIIVISKVMFLRDLVFE